MGTCTGEAPRKNGSSGLAAYEEVSLSESTSVDLLDTNIPKVYKEIWDFKTESC